MAGQANDSEKLPWLEPYREPAVAAPARKAKKPPKLKAVAPGDRAPPAQRRRRVPRAARRGPGHAGVGQAAGGGGWAGNRNAPATPEPAPTVTIPVAKIDPIPMPEVVEPEVAEEAGPGRAVAPRPAASRARPAPLRAATRSAPPPRPEAAPPMPKVMAIRFSPPPSAGKPGQVVDLGRYLSPNLADSAYRSTVGRYPYLGGLAKVVAPQPVVYGQPRLYALQLGARTPREARQLCDNLKKIGRPCTVR